MNTTTLQLLETKRFRNLDFPKPDQAVWWLNGAWLKENSFINGLLSNLLLLQIVDFV